MCGEKHFQTCVEFHVLLALIAMVISSGMVTAAPTTVAGSPVVCDF